MTDRLAAYAKAVSCSIEQVVQVAVADLVEFNGSILSQLSLGEEIFDGLSAGLRNAVLSYLDDDEARRLGLTLDDVIESAVQSFLHVEATSFADPKLTEWPITVETRQLSLLYHYLPRESIAA